MAKWYPHLYNKLGGGHIGCPNCLRPWGVMNFFNGDMETNFSSIEEALSIRTRCDGGQPANAGYVFCWEGLIKDLIEIPPFGGWNKIIQWWEEATETKVVVSTTNKSVEEFLKKQRDNNLRAIFG